QPLAGEGHHLRNRPRQHQQPRPAGEDLLTMAAIDKFLRTMLDKGGSDLHLTIGLPPKARISGSLQAIATETLDAATMERMLKEIVHGHRWDDFLARKDLDLAHEIPGVARFRANFLYNHWGQAAVFHEIPVKIPSFAELKLPEALKKFCHLQEGLVVVTGPFAAALKGAMRHDPDILMLGEMRERETIKLALSCASMGMLVFGTLHTN